MDNRFYNYAYLDSNKPGIYKYKLETGDEIYFEYEPFYIGKGTGYRYLKHKYKCSGRFMKSKLKSLENLKSKPIIIKFKTDITNKEACNIEKLCIKVIGRRDLNTGSLVNLTDGGEGVINLNDDIKRKMSLLKIGKTSPRKGCKLSDETKLKLSILNSGSNHPKFGLKHSNETKAKISATRNKIPILQYSMNNVLIEEYVSITHAAKQLEICDSNIVKCLKGKIKSYKGFKWIYK